jgi:hypothetical protein
VPWTLYCSTGAQGAAAERIFGTFSDPARLFWYQDFSGSNAQIQVFFCCLEQWCSKFGLHKGYPLM